MQIKDVHTEHCCIKHGCKYGDPNCPVATGDKIQSFPCESCMPLGYYAVAYAAPMPEEIDPIEVKLDIQKLETYRRQLIKLYNLTLYEQQLNKLLKTIESLKGLTSEVKQLKDLAKTIETTLKG